MPRKRKNPLALHLRTETIHSIIALIFIALGVLVILSFSGQGVLLQAVNTFLSTYFGISTLLIPFISIAAGLVMFRTKWSWSQPHVLLGSMLLLVGTMGLLKTGAIGEKTFLNISLLITPIGAAVLFIAILVAGLLIMSQLSMAEVFEFIASKQPAPAVKEASEEGQEDGKKSRFGLPGISLPFGKKKGFDINTGSTEDDPVDEEEVAPSTQGAAAAHVQLDLKKLSSVPHADAEMSESLTPNTSNVIWEYPPLSLLEESEGGEADRGDVKKNAQTIEGALESFGIRAEVKEVNYGPSVTQYALEIARGTKLSKITGLATDLALALAAPTGQIRIEAPIAGRSLVGVEVPNYSAQYVTLRKMLSSPIMKKHPSKLATALGINVAGQPVVMDIAKMPHLLIAGSTGSGKSVSINTFMCSMLFRASPSEVKFILVDPKRVELTGYNDIPHLLTPVIVEPKKVVSALKWATAEMDSRYKQLAEVGVKNITGYNELAGHTAMSSIVIVIDELADVMLFAPAEVEECITRIAQMARAVGIHLVLATQRPSVDVLTGLIKANVPGRIAFNVSSMMDSRVILDTPGAEKLLGKGDMLFIPPDQAKAQRIQGTYVSDKEIGRLIAFIKAQGQQPHYEEEITTKYKVNTGGGSDRSGDGEERDQLFIEAAQFVASEGKGSSSLIQRRFSVGYNRAARILDQLYAAGMVGPADGSKPREVYTAKVMEFLRAQEQSD